MNNCLLLENIVYGSHERQRVDIFIPEDIKSASGLILFIHGGGWTDGDKTVHHPDASYFCDRGYISASMNYRFVAEDLNVFYELDDITAALGKIKEVCSERGFNTEKVILSGGSAGGHLALMYAYTRMAEAPVTPVAACVYCPGTDCAGSDFLLGIAGEFEDWKYGVLSWCCGLDINKTTLMNPEQQRALTDISPIRYVSSDCVPTAVFHGKKDELVPFEHTERFLRALTEKGVKNDLIIYENSGHALDKDPETTLKTKEMIISYAELYL